MSQCVYIIIIPGISTVYHVYTPRSVLRYIHVSSPVFICVTHVVLILAGEFVKAAEFCETSCKAVDVAYGSYSIEIATELRKLAQLLFKRYNTS